MKPLVTIAIPTYKALFLRESIASALAQTYTHIELIIVNDQSPDDIGTIVDSFHDERIRYFVNAQNLGAKDPSANWNECLRLAHGEFFCLLCDDDQYAPTFVETLLELSERHPKSSVFRSGVRIVNSKGEETDFYPASPEWETVEDYMWHVYRGLRRQTISEFMFRRSAMVEAGGYTPLPYAWGSDYLSIYRFALEGGITSTWERLTIYRDSGNNISSDQKFMDEKLLTFKGYIEQVKSMIEQQQMPKAPMIIPAISHYYKQAILDHMLEADRKALGHILLHPKKFDVSLSILLRYLIRRVSHR